MSIHDPGHIRQANVSAPDWLVEKLTTARASNGKGHDPASWATGKAQKVFEYRDYAVASVAGKLLRARSLDAAFVLTLVLDWNACHCDPPLPDDKVEEIFNRIGKREHKRREASHGIA